MRVPKKIAELVSILQEKHAKDILVLQLSRMATFTNYFIICTGESIPQVKAIAEEVFNKL
ncbi:MAG: ribosome silencing factor RsfS, partial [bacterium (Candidatus Ratteibacteria) CG23_combo_of_CG06-09_8_20_14_all_48_7]